MIVGFNYVLPFGKHVGKRIQTVLKHDPQYIRWAMANIHWFEPSEHVLNALDRIEIVSGIEKSRIVMQCRKV